MSPFGRALVVDLCVDPTLENTKIPRPFLGGPSQCHLIRAREGKGRQGGLEERTSRASAMSCLFLCAPPARSSFVLLSEMNYGVEGLWRAQLLDGGETPRARARS